MKLIIRWLITAVAVFLTAWLMPGIRIEGTNAFVTVGIVAVILGLVNEINARTISMNFWNGESFFCVEWT